MDSVCFRKIGSRKTKNILFECNLKYSIKYNSRFKGDFIAKTCKNNEEQASREY